MVEHNPLFSERGKKLYIAGRASTVILGLAAGSLSLAIGTHNYMRNVADRGPALIFKGIEIDPAYAGQITRIRILIDKKRHCSPVRAVVQVIDKDGVVHPGTATWPGEFPVADAIKGLLMFEVPWDLKPGLTKGGTLAVYHSNCSDGVDPEFPAIIEIPPIFVKK